MTLDSLLAREPIRNKIASLPLIAHLETVEKHVAWLLRDAWPGLLQATVRALDPLQQHHRDVIHWEDVW
jgi:hypothetical protein